jgi:hypothetical protein
MMWLKTDGVNLKYCRKKPIGAAYAAPMGFLRVCCHRQKPFLSVLARVQVFMADTVYSMPRLICAILAAAR